MPVIERGRMTAAAVTTATKDTFEMPASLDELEALLGPYSDKNQVESALYIMGYCGRGEEG